MKALLSRRELIAITPLLLLGGFIMWGALGLPGFGRYPGPYGTVLSTIAVHQREIPNVVTAVNYDYRGLDTMGEEFILFGAVAGLALLLRHERSDALDAPLPPGRRHVVFGRSDAMRLGGIVAVGLTVLFGAYIVIHGHLTPGGGFQGGAVLGSAIFIAFLGLGFPTFRELAKQERMNAIEALAAGGYVCVGIATLAASGAFLRNTLGLDGEGRLYSAGTIPLINDIVGIEVASAFALVFLEFARLTRQEKANAESDQGEEEQAEREQAESDARAGKESPSDPSEQRKSEAAPDGPGKGERAADGAAADGADRARGVGARRRRDDDGRDDDGRDDGGEEP